jgi:hypothetical protein
MEIQTFSNSLKNKVQLLDSLIYIKSEKKYLPVSNLIDFIKQKFCFKKFCFLK